MLGSFIDDVVSAGAVQVISVRGHRNNPAFSYTIGRYRNFGEPELLMHGICFPRAGEALQELAAVMEAEPHRDSWTLSGSGLTVRACAISRRRVEKYMLLATTHYGHADFPALEVEVVADCEAAA